MKLVAAAFTSLALFAVSCTADETQGNSKPRVADAQAGSRVADAALDDVSHALIEDWVAAEEKPVFLPGYVPAGFTVALVESRDLGREFDYRTALRVLFTRPNDTAWIEVTQDIGLESASVTNQEFVRIESQSYPLVLRKSAAFHELNQPDGSSRKWSEPSGRFEARIAVQSQGLRLVATNGMCADTCFKITEGEVIRIVNSLKRTS